MSNQLTDYHYDLPAGRIAQNPTPDRADSRMMILHRAAHSVRDARFADLPDHLRPGDLLVCNDTRVFPARLLGRKRAGGGAVELLLLTETGDGDWQALVRPGRRLAEGSTIDLPAGGSALVGRPNGDGSRRVRLHLPESADAYLDRHGLTPLPPYIRGGPSVAEAFHRERYQTVFARSSGSVAAPTAGLHFTPAVLGDLSARGVAIARLTLHVGPGTFRPVRSLDITTHRMDAERFEIPDDTAEAIHQTRRRGGRVVAVGTTTTRALEHAARAGGGVVQPGGGCTDLFITPGFRFQVIDGLLTNFHLPGSTLLMLVSALAGREWVLECYTRAVAGEYRFYSYGDCMLILP